MSHEKINIVKFNRKKHKRDPWITFGILKSVHKKNLLYKKKLRKLRQIPLTMKLESKNLKPIKTLCDVSLIKQKKLYFPGQIIKQRGTGSKTWQTIDNALHRKSNKTSPNAELIVADICTNKENMANACNNNFANICTTIVYPTSK